MVREAIVVCTWGGGRDWATQCLNSIKGTNYPIVVVINGAGSAPEDWIEELEEFYTVLPLKYDRYEIGAINAVYKHLPEIEDFWLIQDTIVIKDIALFDFSFNELDGKSVSYTETPYLYYLGKWRREVLTKLYEESGNSFPTVLTKQDAIHWEIYFPRRYLQVEPLERQGYMDDELSNINRKNYIVTLFGQDRYVLYGKYIDKYLSLSKDHYNIPAHWNDKMYQEFLDYWRGKRNREND